jgi:hypothetical protein
MITHSAGLIFSRDENIALIPDQARCADSEYYG